MGRLGPRVNHLSIALNMATVDAIVIAQNYDRPVNGHMGGKARERSETTLGDGFCAIFLSSEFRSMEMRAIAGNAKPAATRDRPIKKDTTAPPASPKRKQRRPWVYRHTTDAHPPGRRRPSAPARRPRNRFARRSPHRKRPPKKQAAKRKWPVRPIKGDV